MKKIIFLLIVFASVIQLQAQHTPTYYDVVYLKNGSEFRGQLREFQPEYITIKILGGKVLTFQQTDIEKIIQEPTTGARKQRKPYAFKERGLYKAVFGSFNAGTAAWSDDYIEGIGVKGVVGYQWNRWLGAGLGFGLDNYNPSQGETVYPVFVELRGYLSQKNVSPYYTISGGYSFTVVNEEAGISEASGGYLFHPAIGLRFGGSSNANFTLDAGIQLQKATFVRGDISDWAGAFSQSYQMLYKRLSIRVGVLF